MSTPSLREIHVNNFKSYVGQHSFGPFARFSCVVGPNGSGKSNFTDAIGFVLGIDPAFMRVRQIRDFVSHGATHASVSIHIVIANALRVITREVAVAQENVHMQLHCDGKSITQSELTDLLASSGILVDLKNFLIFQNEVEAITLKKAKDMTAIIERMSGSDAFKAEYDALKSNIEGISRKMNSLAMEKKELVGEINRFRAQSKDNDRFKDLQSKEKKALVFKNLFLLLVNECGLAEKKHMLAEAEKDVERLESAYTEQVREIKSKKQAFADIHKKHLLSMQKVREKTSAHRDSNAHMEKLKTTIDHLQRQCTQMDRESSIHTKSLQGITNSVASVKASLAAKEAEQASFEAQCTAELEADESTQLSKANLAEYQTIRKEVDCDTVLHRQRMESIRKKRSLLEDAIRRDEALLDDTDAALKSAAEQLQFTQESLEGLKLSQAEAKDELKSSKAAHESCRTQTQRAVAILAEKQRELQRIDMQIDSLQGSHEESRQAKLFADALGAMKALTRGVRGRLVDLCSIPNERYRIAATVALGKNLESIVVETQAQAMSCIRYLKDNRVGVMEFVPLDSAKGKHVDERCRSFGGTCRPVIDVFKYEAWLEPAVRYALGQTLVCDTIEEAMRVAHNPFGPNFSVVTIDGSVILKNGAIQGGLQSVQQKARKWDEKEYADLKELREKLQLEVFDASGGVDTKNGADITATQQQVTASEKKCEQLHSESDALKERIQMLREEIATHEKSKAKTAQSVERSNAGIAELEKEIDAVRRTVREMELKAFAKLQKKIGKKCDLLLWEERKGQLAAMHAEKRQHFILQVSLLQNRLAVEQKKLDLQSAADAHGQLRELEARIESLAAELTQQKQVVETRQTESREASQHFDEVRKLLLSTESAIRTHSKANVENSEAVADARKRALLSTVGCKKLRTERSSMFLQSVLDNSIVPYALDTPGTAESEAKRQRRRKAHTADGEAASDDGIVSTKLSIRFSEPFDVSDNPLVRSVINAENNSQSETLAVCVDFASIPEKQRRAVAHRQHEDELVTLERSLAHIREEIRALSPSIKAGDQVSRHEEALGKISTALEAQKGAYKTNMNSFYKVQESRRTAFQRTFDSINESVGRIYKDLTEGTRGAIEVHGSAYLTLDNTEEPFLHGTKYHATPPLKRFMGMDALSGGERTMAALALLFAFYTVKPAPLMVLDEVDAALDHANVQKLAQYIRQHASSCQFIVVSLNAALFGQADSLFGVFKDKQGESSRVLSLDLSAYAEHVE